MTDSSHGGFRAAAVYSGRLYKKAGNLTDLNRARITVISAGYGLVGADDPIYDYNYEMKGCVAEDWKELGLHNVIAELIGNEQPTDIVGFFTGKPIWNRSSAMYRWFYETGVRRALGHGCTGLQTAGTVFNEEGRSASSGGLGEALNDFLGSNLSLPTFYRSLQTVEMPKGVKLAYASLMPGSNPVVPVTRAT